MGDKENQSGKVYKRKCYLHKLKLLKLKEHLYKLTTDFFAKTELNSLIRCLVKRRIQRSLAKVWSRRKTLLTHKGNEVGSSVS